MPFATLTSSMTGPFWYSLCFAMYLLLVRSLRYRRANGTPKKYSLTKRADFAKMTADQAQAVLKDMTELEFPKFMGFSIVFALFKVHTCNALLRSKHAAKEKARRRLTS